MITLLGGRAFQLQVVEGSRWHGAAEGNRVVALPQTAPRGILYDHTGKQLVENVASSDVVLNPVSLPGDDDESLLLDKLPTILGVTHDEVRQRLTQAREELTITPLARAITHEQVIALKNNQEELPGVQVISSLVRDYTYPYAMAHVLGYTGTVTAQDLEEQSDLLLTEPIGKAGLESFYNSTLRGKHGVEYVEVDARNRPQKVVGGADPQAGVDLNLNIDAQLQKFIFDVLAENHRIGAVVAVDPNSGAVRALVSYPSYDANVFAQPAYRANASQFLENKEQPLFNRVISGIYPPGSTIKPFLAATALEKGVISQQTTIMSTGGLFIGPWRFPDWKAGGHGVTDVKKAIAESVNTFFYIVAGGHESYEGLGVSQIKEGLEKFGWGRQTGIDLPNEALGHLPTPEWKKEVKGEPWYIGDTYHLGIGQGDVLATPMQIAASTVAIANGGTLYHPRIVQLNEPPVGEPVGMAATHIETVRQGMRDTVRSGSGKALDSLPIATAGKTGTAQTGAGDTTHAWYTSFGPYESPSLVVTILLEEGGEGDEDAVPVAREIWQWWAENRAK